MKSFLLTVRRFLTAEEVPRWFGLSVVLIYLVGLGTVARVGISLARRDAQSQFVRSSDYAASLLAAHLGGLELDPSDPASLAACRKMLREFATATSARAARVVHVGRVIASSEVSDVGASSSLAPSAADRGGQVVETWIAGPQETQDRLVQVRLSDGVRLAGAHLEVVLPAEPADASRLAGQAGTLAVVLAVLGALGVVYRCLREQLRGVWRIRDRLESRSAKIEEDLSSLRIGDALDSVTSSWNELVDLAERLLATVQRAEANEELSKALDRAGGGALAEALDAFPDGLMHITSDDRVSYANAAALRLLGLDANRLKSTRLSDAKSSGVGQKILQLLCAARHPAGYFESRAEVLDAGVGSASDSSDRGAYRIQVIPLQDAAHEGECVVALRDVSQQMRTDKAREDFVAQVTHELRTPLTNIRAYTETLASGAFDDPKVTSECYNVITKETRRLSRLIEDILSVSQLEVGSIELQVDNVDLRALLSEGVRDVRGLAEEKNIDLRLALPSKLEPIRGDRDKLAVVVNNILGNAIKYTPSGGTVQVGGQVSREEVVLTFKDNGAGIDPSEHALVFEKFQRGSNPEVQAEPTGIGLYTAREIVRRHGGEVSVIAARGTRVRRSWFVFRRRRIE